MYVSMCVSMHVFLYLSIHLFIYLSIMNNFVCVFVFSSLMWHFTLLIREVQSAPQNNFSPKISPFSSFSSFPGRRGFTLPLFFLHCIIRLPIYLLLCLYLFFLFFTTFSPFSSTTCCFPFFSFFLSLFSTFKCHLHL